jgi:F0F1-type ATP synthase membrane subunit b/b'
MIDKKLICWIIFSGVGIWIGRISWFRYKSFTKMLKEARSDIVYGVAEAKELLKEFPDQKYIYIQGYALPNEKD